MSHDAGDLNRTAAFVADDHPDDNVDIEVSPDADQLEGDNVDEFFDDLNESEPTQEELDSVPDAPETAVIDEEETL